MRFEVRSIDPPLDTKRGRGKPPLVIDEHLLSLKEPLGRKGFTVLTPKQGKPEQELVAEDLPGRIFVTDNPRDMVYSASLLDYSIIDTHLVTRDPQDLASMIARAFIDYSLKSERPAFMLVLMQDGRHLLATDL